MPKFKIKLRIIEAQQYIKKGELVDGICNHPKCFKSLSYSNAIKIFHVHSIHNNQLIVIEVGDWIIPEPDGEHYYPIKANVFAANHEPI